MHDDIVPEWIKDEAEREEQEALETSAEDDSKQAAELTIKTEVGEYWQQFMKELALTVEGLSKLQIGGTILRRPSGYENHCQVSIHSLGATARQTYTDIFHAVNTRKVRCHTLGGKAFQLYFTIRADGRGIGLVSSDNFVVMNPTAAAEYVMRPMVQWLRGHSPLAY